MGSSFSDLVNNLSEGINKIQCKYRHDDKKCETCRIKYKYCNCFLACTISKGNLIEQKCFMLQQIYQLNFEEKLKRRFLNTNKFSKKGYNKFILLLSKGAYPYEYMGDFEKFNETLLLEKEDFWTLLMQITCAQKKFVKNLKLKNLGEYHDLYV